MTLHYGCNEKIYSQLIHTINPETCLYPVQWGVSMNPTASRFNDQNISIKKFANSNMTTRTMSDQILAISETKQGFFVLFTFPYKQCQDPSPLYTVRKLFLIHL